VAICLRMCLLSRPTRREAIAAAEALLPDDKAETTVAQKDDSQMYGAAKTVARDARWLSESLWIGFVPHYGPVWTTLIGSHREVADAFMAYKQIGVTEFIISGWPEVDEMVNFSQEVMPLIRERERQLKN